MNKRARSLLAYLLFFMVVILGIIFLTNIVIAFTGGNSDLKINYNLITSDIAGRHYTPTCLGTCDLVFSLIYSGVNAPTSVAIDTNKLRTQFNWAKGQDKFQKSEIYYLNEFQEEVKDYSTVCLPYNTTDGFEGNWTYSYFSNCTQVASGSHLEKRQEWKELTKEIALEKGKTYYIDIRGYFKMNTQEGFKVDVVPLVKIATSDFMLSEMAWWTGIPYSYKRVVYYNTTQTTFNKQVIYAINGTEGINGSVCWGTPNDRFTGNTNYTEYLYYNDFNNFSLVNQTEDTQRPLDCENSSVASYNNRQVWDSSYVTAVYHFNSTGGSVLGNNIVYNGTPTYGTAGLFGSAVTFDGSNDWGTIYSSAQSAIDPVANNMSVLMWYNLNDTSATQIGMAVDYGATRFWDVQAIRNDNGYKPRFVVDCSGTEKTVDGTGSIAVGQWYMVVATFDGANMNIYVNDTAVVSDTCVRSGVTSGSTHATTIGALYSGGAKMNGILDELRVYNKSLTAEEVKDLYQEGLVKYGRSLLGPEQTYDTIPPSITQLIITPQQPRTSDDLKCNATLTDNKAVNLTAYWRWYKNNQLYLSGLTSVQNGTDSLITTLLAGNTSKGEQWICEVKPFDGVNYGNASNSSAITIVNTPPAHTQPKLQATSKLNTTSDNLTCYNQSTSDVDNDAVTNIYNWYKNSQPLIVLNMPFENSARDYSTYNNTGTIYGASFTSGKIGKALQFDGMNDYVEIIDSDSLDFNTKKTWQLWFKRTTTGAETLFNKGNATQSNYKLEFLSNNNLKFSYSLALGMADYSWQVKTENDFNEGTYNQIYYNTTYSAIMLSNTYSGDYKSKIYSDSGKTLSFKTISFSADVPTIAELSPEAGMVGLWHFNEGSGTTAYDSTDSNNDGTIYGATWTSEGKFNSALSFDGNGDYVSTSMADFPTGNENITVEAWFKIDDLDSDNAIVNYGKSSTHNALQLVHRASDDKLVFHYWGGYGAVTTSLNDHEWHHAAAVHISNTNYLYLDGELKGQTSYASANIINNFNEIGRVVGYPSYDFDGIIDEVAVYNKALSAGEIQEHYNKGIGLITNLSLAVRSCTQSDCSDKASSWDISGITSSPHSISSLADNKYFQLKSEFSTNDTQYSPKLYNFTLAYSAQVTDTETNLTSSAITDTNWHLATITFDNNIATNNFKLYLDNSLATQKTEHTLPSYKDNSLTIAQYFNGTIDEFKIYQDALTPQQIAAHYNQEYNKIVAEETNAGETYLCQVTPNDAESDGITLNSTSLTVLWNITFDVRSGETNESLNNFNIYCNNSFTALGINSPYSIGFLPGSYSCEFEKAYPSVFYNKTIEFRADNDKTINVVMSRWFYLTIQEHSWLEALYECLINGNCEAFNLWKSTNQTVFDIWQQVTRTNRNVVTQEQFISNTLSSSSNITINYTIQIPFKSGYANGELLPLRMYFWFTDVGKTHCYNQNKETDSNRAEAPYCFPLVSETLGPNNGSVTFTVDLRPNLPSGNYNITRAIEIDPILESIQRWVNYGQEDIGQVVVEEGNEEPSIGLDKTGETLPPKTGFLTGDAIQNIQDNINKFLNGEQFLALMGMLTFVVSLGIICLTIYKIKKLSQALSR